MKIDISQFFGIAPLADPLALPPGYAQTALNCDLRGGVLAPLKSYRNVLSLGVSGVKSIHKFGYQSGNESQYWFAFNADVNVAKGQVFNDVEERTYFTGDWPSGTTKMKKTRLGLANAGSGPYPAAWLLGSVPRPGNTPAVSATGGDTTLAPELRTYFETFVTAWDEESKPSPASARVSVNSGGTASVSGLAPAPSGAYVIDRRRLYRSAYTGTQASTAQLVAELPIATTSYTDTIAQADLGGSIATLDFDETPDGLAGLIALPNSMMAGFKGFDVYFFEPGYPYATPIKYSQTLEAPVVGLGAYGQTLVALTTGVPYIGSGVDPEQVISRAEVPETHSGCLSKRGIVSVPGAVYYPTQYGIAGLSPGQAQMVTEKYVNNLQWSNYAPSTMLGCAAGSRLIFFYDTGTVQRGLILDPSVPGMVETTIFATAAHRTNGKLYLSVGDNLVAWEEGSAYLSYTWKSRKYTEPRLSNMSVGKVIADAYPVTLKLYGDGVLRATKTVADNNEFSLPGGYVARTWELQLEGSNKVRRAAVAETAEELLDVAA